MNGDMLLVLDFSTTSTMHIAIGSSSSSSSSFIIWQKFLEFNITENYVLSQDLSSEACLVHPVSPTI